MTAKLTETKTPMKDLMHLLTDHGKCVKTHLPGDNDLLTEIAGLCMKILNPETSVIYIENMTPNKVNMLLRECLVPYGILEIGKLSDMRVEYKIEEAPNEIRGDKEAIDKVLTRYISECAFTGTMIEIEESSTRFLRCVTEIYDAIYGRFYDDLYGAYSVEEINMLLMHRKIPYYLRKSHIVCANYGHRPMEGFTINKCNW